MTNTLSSAERWAREHGHADLVNKIIADHKALVTLQAARNRATQFASKASLYALDIAIGVHIGASLKYQGDAVLRLVNELHRNKRS